jgi:hypothetical protein
MKRCAVLLFAVLSACSDPVAVSRSTSHTGTTTDLFLVAGQSNARGELGLNTLSDLRHQYRSSTIISLSAWPAFGVRYYALTGRNVAIVNTRSGAGSQTIEAAPTLTRKNWDTTGALVPASMTTLDSVLALSPVYHLKGIIWSQGEQDQRYILDGTLTPERYRQALETMIARYRDKYGPTLRFYIVRTGRATSGDHKGWRGIRSMQEAVANADPYTSIAYRGTVGFPDRGLMLDGDENHYSKDGLIIVGRAVASFIHNNDTPAP